MRKTDRYKRIFACSMILALLAGLVPARPAEAAGGVVTLKSPDAEKEYSSLEDAWEEAKDYTDHNKAVTLVLKKDVVLDDTLDIDGAGAGDARLTLDLNGHSIDGKDIDKGDGMFDIDDFNDNIDLLIKGGTLKNNRGRMIYLNDRYSKLIVRNVTISDVNCDKSGGVVYHNNGTFSMDKCSVENNVCMEGSIYLNKSGASVSGTFFKNNNAEKSGGVIYVNASSCSISDCEFFDNSAGKYGGAVCINSGKCSISNSNFKKNVAEYGGAVYIDGANATLSGGEYSDNTATIDGGAVYNFTPDSTLLKDIDIIGNTAKNYGAGVFGNSRGELLLGGSIQIIGNERKDGTMDNLYLETSIFTCHIKPQGLTSEALIGLSLKSFDEINVHLTFSDGLHEKHRELLFSDDPRYGITKNFTFEKGLKNKPSTGGAIKPLQNNAPKPDMTSYAGCPIEEGVVTFPAQYDNDYDVRAKFYYSDGFFAGPATTYDKHLSTMSMCLALGAMGSNAGGNTDYTDRSSNGRQLLTDLGCVDICINDCYTYKPTSETIGVIMGHKTIKTDNGEYTLMPIGIRGATYGAEWISNVTIGGSGEHEGFAKAADMAFNSVKEYIDRFGLDVSRTKFWIAGFSRAAAVTDLLSKRLTDAYDPSGESVYGYGFAAPQGAYYEGGVKEKTYNNIHCILDPGDLVPKVAPSYMGFGHYGEEIYMTDSKYGSAEYKKEKAYMVGQLEAITKEYKLLGEFYPASFYLFDTALVYPDVDMTQPEFLDKLLKFLEKNVASDRKTFFSKTFDGGMTIQQILGKLASYAFVMSPEHMTEIKDALLGALDFSVSDKLHLYWTVRQGLDVNYEGKHEKFYDLVWSYIEAPLRKAMTDEEFEEIKSMKESLIQFVVEFAHNDYEQGKDNYMEIVGTMMNSMSMILQTHAHANYLAWLRTKDDFYNGEYENMGMVDVTKAKLHGDDLVRVEGTSLYLDTQKPVSGAGQTDVVSGSAVSGAGADVTATATQSQPSYVLTICLVGAVIIVAVIAVVLVRRKNKITQK